VRYLDKLLGEAEKIPKQYPEDVLPVDNSAEGKALAAKRLANEIKFRNEVAKESRRRSPLAARARRKGHTEDIPDNQQAAAAANPDLIKKMMESYCKLGNVILEMQSEGINIDKAKKTINKLQQSKNNNLEAGGRATGDAMEAAALEKATGIPSVTKVSKMLAANKTASRVSKREVTIKRLRDAIAAAKKNPEDYPSLR